MARIRISLLCSGVIYVFRFFVFFIMKLVIPLQQSCPVEYSVVNFKVSWVDMQVKTEGFVIMFICYFVYLIAYFGQACIMMSSVELDVALWIAWKTVCKVMSDPEVMHQLITHQMQAKYPWGNWLADVHQKMAIKVITFWVLFHFVLQRWSCCETISTECVDWCVLLIEWLAACHRRRITSHHKESSV